MPYVPDIQPIPTLYPNKISGYNIWYLQYLLELSRHACKMNPDPNTNLNRDNPNNLLNTISW